MESLTTFPGNPGIQILTKNPFLGCDSVGRAVAYNITGPQFDCSLWHNFVMNILLLTVKKTIK